MQTAQYAVISAAGLGSRLELNMPKCLVEIGGRRIIDYQLDLLQNVPNVRVVVGFMEDKVMEHVRRHRDDVVFVRNPDYASTTNSHSLNLGSRDLKVPYLAIDGDLLLVPESFRQFLEACRSGRTIIGVTPSKTEEAVFVELDEQKQVVGFQRKPRTGFEWSGLAQIAGIQINPEIGYVYKNFEPFLPLESFNIECYEIDTPEDLSYALEHFRAA